MDSANTNHLTRYSYLALGDSYTVGEQVKQHESFPAQTVQLLRKQGYTFYAPEVVAVTGYTTDELQALLAEQVLLPAYDVVSILIGVNNQYRGRTADSFLPDMEKLVQQAIQWTNHHANRVFVLSIPDWGVTPFAENRNRAEIALEIDNYNAICKAVAADYGCNYIDITSQQRIQGHALPYLANDQLHPSALEYVQWAEQLAHAITTVIATD